MKEPSSPTESDRVLQDINDIDNDNNNIEDNGNIKSSITKNINAKKRPTSAPSTRRRVTSPSSRLYQPRVVDDSVVAKEVVVPTKPTIKKMDDDKYTYDMKSGRRILISQDELNRKNHKL